MVIRDFLHDVREWTVIDKNEDGRVFVPWDEIDVRWPRHLKFSTAISGFEDVRSAR